MLRMSFNGFILLGLHFNFLKENLSLTLIVAWSGIPTLQIGSPSSILDEVRDFNLDPGTLHVYSLS